MDDLHMRERVLSALRQVAPDVDTATVDPTVSFHRQFGIDSIDFLNFVVALEEMLGMRIAEADQLCLATLDGCLAYLAARPGSGSPSPET